MKTTRRIWITRAVAAALAVAALALVASCNFDFLNGDDSEDEEPTYHYTYDYAGDEISAAYCWNQDDVLQWSEHYAYDTDGNKTSVQHYLADGDLDYTILYAWESGKMTIEAYFGADNALDWYQHSIYDGELLTQLCEYDGSDALQWFAVYGYSASGKKTLAAKNDYESALECAYTWEYNASDLLVTEKTYGSGALLTNMVSYEWNAEGKELRSVTYEAPAPSASLAASARSARAASRAAEPTLPTPPDPPAVPTLTLTDQDLEVASRRFWFYDGYGVTDVTTRADYLPTAIVREDSRIEEDVSVALTYDEAGRPLSKTTCYGSTEALKIVLTYTSESGYWVSHIQSSGAAMAMPLNFDLSYDEAGIPTEVTVSYDTSTLLTLTYEYDPANLLEHTITVREGDGSLYGCYVFTLASDYLSGRIDVYTDEACTVSSGYYLLAYDDSRTVSFAAYDAEGNPVVRYEYDYEDLQGLGEQALMVAETKFGFDAQSEYDAVIDKLEAGDFDFTALLRVRSAEDVAKLFL